MSGKVHILRREEGKQNEQRVKQTNRTDGLGIWKPTDFAAIAVHRERASETERMTALGPDSDCNDVVCRGLTDFFRCALNARWRRKSAGEASSSVTRRNISSGRSNGESIVLYSLS